MDRVTFLNFNAYRSVDIQRMNRFLDIIKRYNASIITIQEIHIGNALKVFQKGFRVFVNVARALKPLRHSWQRCRAGGGLSVGGDPGAAR